MYGFENVLELQEKNSVLQKICQKIMKCVIRSRRMHGDIISVTLILAEGPLMSY